MIVDSSALIAILLNEPGAERLADALADAPAPRISAANLLEAMLVITARLGPAGTQALRDLMEVCALSVEPVDHALAEAAFTGWLRFGKGRHPAGLNFGDCFAYALAQQPELALLFKGDDFRRTDVIAAV